jgi:hypothetical protein
MQTPGDPEAAEHGSSFPEAHRPEREILDLERALDALRDEFVAAPNTALAYMQSERARSLYRGVRHAAAGPSGAECYVVARALVEVALVAAWVAKDPRKRLVSWQAHSADEEVKLSRALAAIDDESKSLLNEPAYLERQRLASGPKMPDLASVAKDVGPEAVTFYSVFYRTLSSWTHATNLSFQDSVVETGTALEITEAGLSRDHALSLRQQAAMTYAYAMESLCGWAHDLNGTAGVRAHATQLKEICGSLRGSADAEDPVGLQNHETTVLLRKTLARVPALRVRGQAITLSAENNPGSLAELDQRDPQGRYVCELAQGAIGVAGDHLESWRRLIEAETQPGFSHMTLLRAVLEGSSFARWLLDPTATSAQRIQRGVAAQLADYEERRKWEVASGIDSVPRSGNARSGRQRRDDVTRARNAGGVTEIRVLPFVELCKNYAIGGTFGGEGLYRLASGFAHSKQWVLLLSEHKLHPELKLPTGAIASQVTADDPISAAVTSLAVKTFTAAVVDLERYVR